jgi:hypothetical protein
MNSRQTPHRNILKFLVEQCRIDLNRRVLRPLFTLNVKMSNHSILLKQIIQLDFY